MMQFFKILRLFLIFCTFAASGQTIQQSLHFINRQCAQFNKYDTSCDVDPENGKIIFFDKYGMYSALLNDVEFKSGQAGVSIEIGCDGETKCFSSLKKDGSPGQNFPAFTIGFSKNGEDQADIEALLQHFYNLKNSVLQINPDAVALPDDISKSDIETQLQMLNALFDEHSPEAVFWSFDFENQFVMGKTNSCEWHIPITRMSISFIENDTTKDFQNGIIFQAHQSDIIENCSGLESRISRTVYYLDSLEKALDAIRCLEIIQHSVLSQSGVNTTDQASGLMAQLLNYINGQFEKYNQYQTRFYVDVATQELVWVQEFGISRAQIGQISFSADQQNGWLLINCEAEDLKCITSTSFQGQKYQSEEYSMSIKENDQIIPHFDTVVAKFYELKTVALK